MGIVSSRRASHAEAERVDTTVKYPTSSYTILPHATSDEIHHFQPPNFPIYPAITTTYLRNCCKTWKVICTANTPKMRGYGKQGIVLFYDEFFHRLFQRDSSLEGVFPSIKKRSEVLIKAMTFVLKGSIDDPALVANRCRHLGYAHRTFDKLKPHHFAVYVGVCIEVIMYWLGDDATPDVGEAWSNLFGFNLKHMLQAYLYGIVDETDCQQNTITTA